jgi:hypothetical protein
MPSAFRTAASSTTAVVRDDAFRQGAAEDWVGAALTKSGDVGQVVGTLNTLFRVRGPCWCSRSPFRDRCAPSSRVLIKGGVVSAGS